MNVRNFYIVIIILLIFTVSSNIVKAENKALNAVIKVYSVSSKPNPHTPWQNQPNQAKTGSGCLISNNKILTCAHIVSNSTFIMVRKQGDPKKYIAKLIALGEDCDLALLEVNDSTFYKGMHPLEIGTLPLLQDDVSVLGYPVGGDNISITQGVVSRVEPTLYAFSRKWLLGAQIDAAINPGNSGGPVVKENKLVGIAFQGLNESDNIGYMIPAPIIKHFLNDIKKNSKYDGFPNLGVQFERMENPFLRKWAKMKPDQSGIIITHILPEVKKTTKLLNDDILLEVDDVTIANDGTITFRENENILFPYLIWEKYIGDTINLKILRDGRVIEFEQVLQKVKHLVPLENSNPSPSYYIFGGFVFLPLTANYIFEWESPLKPPLELLYLFDEGEITTDRNQVVILSKVLADDFNIGYQKLEHMVIEKINGKKVKNLKHFVELLESSKGEYVIITLKNHTKIILDYNAGIKATPDILKRYRVNAPKSDNL